MAPPDQGIKGEPWDVPKVRHQNGNGEKIERRKPARREASGRPGRSKRHDSEKEHADFKGPSSHKEWGSKEKGGDKSESRRTQGGRDWSSEDNKVKALKGRGKKIEQRGRIPSSKAWPGRGAGKETGNMKRSIARPHRTGESQKGKKRRVRYKEERG